MKKIVISLLIILIFITGCNNFTGNHQNEKVLDTPILSVSENVVKWENVENALIYLFYVDDTIITETTLTSYDMTKFGEGTYEVKVIASGYDGEKSKPSSITVTIDFPEPVRNNVGVFMINDTHGAVIDDDTPGMSRIATIIDEYSKEYGELITVANGDIFQGSYASNILKGKPLVDVLNTLNFDCFVIGNHEFDWGFDKIKVYKDGNLENGEANFPFLGANIYDRATNKMVDWLEPYTIVEKNGLRIGIIGIIGHTLESSILSTNVSQYEFVDPQNIVKTHIKTLRTEKDCDLVIVSNHDYDEELNYYFSSLQGDYAVDLLLCGHTHTNYDILTNRSDGKQIYVIQNRDKNLTASFVNLIVDDNQNYKESYFERLYPNNFAEDKIIKEVLSQYDNIFKEGERVLGTTNSYLSKKTLGTFATDAMIETFQTDIAIINTAGIRDTIDAGEITVSDVFNTFPFDNEIYLVSLLGSKVRSLFSSNASYLYVNKEFDLKSIKDNEYYDIAVIDYVFTSTYYREFKNVDFIDNDIILRDILISYIDNKY